MHDRVDRAKSAAERGHRVLRARVWRGWASDWVGKGNQGERFRDPKHLYADDLDLFGRGSIFELLSTARTAAGENDAGAMAAGAGRTARRSGAAASGRRAARRGSTCAKTSR